MKIEIPFEIGDNVWFIHPKTMKAGQSRLKGLKVEVKPNNNYMPIGSDESRPMTETKIKYNLDNFYNPNEQEFYVWNIFKTKDDLIKSL